MTELKSPLGAVANSIMVFAAGIALFGFINSNTSSLLNNVKKLYAFEHSCKEEGVKTEILIKNNDESCMYPIIAAGASGCDGRQIYYFDKYNVPIKKK